MQTFSSGLYPDTTAVILAGGKARRMGGQDKGLLEVCGRPLIEFVISGLRNQAGHLIINANRNMGRYRKYGYPVIADMSGNFLGPLAGMAAGMQSADTRLILTVPCDSPFIPVRLCDRLRQEMDKADAEISVAHDGIRLQPVFALLRRELLTSLLSYLGEGGRKIDTWYAQHRLAVTDFSASPDAFLNLNTPSDRQAIENLLAGQIQVFSDN